MAIPGYSMASIAKFVGQELGVSNWVAIDQDRINEFARATGDHQWIHVDVERAKRESPFGGTIAHGYLTLSLVAGLTLRWERCRRTQRPASTTVSTRFGSWRR